MGEAVYAAVLRRSGVRAGESAAAVVTKTTVSSTLIAAICATVLGAEKFPQQQRCEALRL